MARIFGFDIGTTSIGFAVIDHDPAAETGEILRLGVRIFPEARDPKGTPLNQTRRAKRMMRRQLRRRRQRRRDLAQVLADAGLLPTPGSEAWQQVMALEPLALRVRGLTEELAPYELGRALYHLAQRRHFRGRELDEVEEAEAADEKAAQSDRESLLAALKASGETLGQYLLKNGPHERRRGVHAHRTVVEDEFNRLWDAQAARPTLSGRDALKAQVAAVMFFQRPVFWRRSTLGKCRFMPGEALCPKGSWLSQQRRMLEKLNNLAVEGGNGRPLDAEERAAILEKLQSQASMTWGAVRTALKPLFKARGEAGAEKTLRFNLEQGGDKTLPGNVLEAKLAGIFAAAWSDHPHRQAIRDSIHQRLWEADYGDVGGQRVVIRSEAESRTRRAQVERALIADFGVTEAQATALGKMALPAGWEPFSAPALRQFMPHLQAGVRFGALLNGPEWEGWRAATFPQREQPTGEIRSRLPSPADDEEQERQHTLRNPTVIRTQNELRKVVNNLLGLYGRPDLIRIELAREVGKSKREREDMQKGQKAMERRRKAAAEYLRKNGIEPDPRDIEKCLLWEECGRFDPYTGRAIGFDALFRTNEFDVEHIWPRSKCFDNSFGNKTLCLKALNVRKANRTPFEAFGSDPDWPGMKQRVWGLANGGKMARGKAKRFCREEALDEDFRSRQLNDTGFATRQAVGFLRRLWPDVGANAPVTVQAVTGRVTAQLRRLWGLNNILSDDGEKTRADHRHHAVDALTVACAHPGLTQKLSRYWQASEDPAAPKPRLDPPWLSIRADAERAVGEMVVSHRVRKKVSGPLHDEMPFGYTGEKVMKGGTELGVYVKRMPVERLSLETLKITRVEEISKKAKFVVRDAAVRKALLAHLQAAGGDPAKAYPPYPRVSAGGPEIHTVRVLDVHQRALMVPVSTGFADAGNNHHIAIYRAANGKVVFEVVSLLCAAGRLARHEPVVQRNRGDGATFVMSLSAGDALEFPEGNRKGIRIVQGVWANGQIVTLDHRDADGGAAWQPSAGAILAQGARKVSIDPIGRVRPARD